MKGMPRFLCGVTILSVLPVMADAAGTYYNGNMYQNPQNRYSNNTTTANGGGFYNNYGAGRGYGQVQTAQNMQTMGTRKTTTTQTVKKTTTKTTGNNSTKQGFYLGANLTHEFANWGFNMKSAGSRLHYDNLRWNALDAELAYYFGDSTPLQVKIGGKYGKQFDESSMVDDDITEGGLWTVYSDGTVEGTPAMSIGTSKGGSEYGFNAAFGLTDFFGNDRIKVTPSIGYRYLKYQLSTKNNVGAMVQIIHNNTGPKNCMEYNGEIQCAPYVVFTDGADHYAFSDQSSQDENGWMAVPNGYPYYNLGGTYYYEQPGTSHKYETEWAGPYIALDMDYIIDNDNLVSAGLEIGLPVYKSTGDQPYRIDWAHPTSVEDKGGLGDAWHIGLNAMWATSISDSAMFTVGMNYDYYSVKGADATTYLNPSYYAGLLEAGYIDEDGYNELAASGWKVESKDEIESIYKSMGIRIGVEVKF